MNTAKASEADSEQPADYRHGDLFAIPLPNGEYACGRVVLDIERQCFLPGLVEPDSNFRLFRNTLLIEVFAETLKTPGVTKSRLLIPGVFVHSAALASKKWPVVGHKRVDPFKVDFPEAVTGLLKHEAHFIKGELSMELLPHSDLDPQKLDCRPSWYSPAYLAECIMYLMGKYGEVPNPQVKDERKLSLGDSDLRFRPEDRAQSLRWHHDAN